VLLEAAASGVPIVATDVGGTAEIVPPDSSSALLVPPDDPAALARATASVLDDASLARAMAATARRRAESTFDARASAASLAHHYGHLLTPHQQGTSGGTAIGRQSQA
jgi:glycosyltransferase involved in cell wall biosynthesis